MNEKLIIAQLNKMLKAQLDSYDATPTMHALFLKTFISDNAFSEIKAKLRSLPKKDDSDMLVTYIFNQIIETKGLQFVLSRISRSHYTIFENVMNWLDKALCHETNKLLRNMRDSYLDKFTNGNAVPNIATYGMYKKDKELQAFFLKIPVDIQDAILNDNKNSNLYLNIIADRFFHDTANNLKINLEFVEEFFKKPDYQKYIGQLDKKDIDNFNHLLDIKETLSSTLTKTQIKQISDILSKEENLPALMYDCISIAKSTIAKAYKESCSNTNEFPSLKDTPRNKFLTKFNIPDDVKVLDITNRPFKFFITVTQIAKSSKLDDFKYAERHSYRDLSSASFVSDKSLVAYESLSSFVTYVYYDFNENDLVMATASDNFHNYKRNSVNGISSYPFSAKSPDEMLAYSNSKKLFNEFNFHFPSNINDTKLTDPDWKKTSVTKPQALLCVNHISNLEAKIAKQYNIPILFDQDYSYRHEYRKSNHSTQIYDRTLD